MEEDEEMHPTGGREVVNIPMPKVLFDNTCREFPIFNMNIPDQYRAHWFMQDVEKRFLKGKQPFPVIRQYRDLLRSRRRAETRGGLSVSCLLHGRQRPGVGADRRIPVTHAVLEEHGDLRDAG